MKIINSQKLRKEYPPNYFLMKNNSPPEGKHPPNNLYVFVKSQKDPIKLIRKYKIYKY